MSWLWVANAAYERDKQGVSKTSTLPEEQIVKVSLVSNVHKPAYYLAVDHSKRCVILCVSNSSLPSSIDSQPRFVGSESEHDVLGTRLTFDLLLVNCK